MERSQLIVILSAIVFCFIFQTFILKTRISESLTAVEETLQKTHHQVESLSEERLGKVSGIIEERGKMFTDTMQDILHKVPGKIEESGKTFADVMKDVPSVISHLKQVHATQKVHEDRILFVLSKLEQYEAEGNHRESVSETKIDQILTLLREGYHGDPIYITVSYMQILWFVFGILLVSTVVCLLRIAPSDKAAEDFAVSVVIGEGGFAVVLVIVSLWQWFRPGFWLLVCLGVCFSLVKLGTYIYAKTKK